MPTKTYISLLINLSVLIKSIISLLNLILLSKFFNYCSIKFSYFPLFTSIISKQIKKYKGFNLEVIIL